LNAVPPELAQDVRLRPDTVHAVTVLMPKLVTNAVEFKMAMLVGWLNPVPPELAQDVRLRPDTVHAVTVLAFRLTTHAMDPTMAML
jgi:hypothetical protein